MADGMISWYHQVWMRETFAWKLDLLIKEEEYLKKQLAEVRKVRHTMERAFDGLDRIGELDRP